MEGEQGWRDDRRRRSQVSKSPYVMSPIRPDDACATRFDVRPAQAGAGGRRGDGHAAEAAEERGAVMRNPYFRVTCTS
jgi:hypothetical protein